MNNISINFENVVGNIKPMHGVGQAPFWGADFSMFHYLTEAKIPFSRLHDVGGAYGQNRYVDIPNLFRDFDADPYDPDSYDFAFTDALISSLIEAGVEPFFRLGVTIENDIRIKAYRVFPPKDNLKWAQICEGVIRHYTEGWANGFHYDIKYWEIWNEPEGKQMWMGTKEEFFELYKVASTYLKDKFPHLKIGGYASCGFYAIAQDIDASNANIQPRYQYYYDYIKEFLEFITENKCPLDFFSWHSYDSIKNNVYYAAHARELLDKYGYTHTEQTLNEWNCRAELFSTAEHAALTCGMMLALQDTPLDSAMFYDARCGVGKFSGMFNALTRKPFLAYYGFVAFSELYSRQSQVEVSMDIPGVYACAAKDDTGCVVIANTNPYKVEYNLNHNEGYYIDKCMQVSEKCVWEEVEMPKQLPEHSIICICFRDRKIS